MAVPSTILYIWLPDGETVIENIILIVFYYRYFPGTLYSIVN